MQEPSQAQFEIVKALIAAGRYGEALGGIDALEVQHPKDRELLYARAHCFAATGRVEQARQLAQTLSAVYADPRGAQLLSRLNAAPAKSPGGGAKRTLRPTAVAALALLAVGAGVFAWLSMGEEDIVLIPTITVEAPVSLQTPDGPINIGNPAMSRMVDWNNDGLLDLLVGGGDGYIWIFLNIGSKSQPLFAKGEIVQDGSRDMRVGNYRTGVCFTDITGDGLKDLVVSHSRYAIGYYPNTGNRRKPAFDGYRSFPGPGGNEFKTLPEPTPGRKLEWIDGRIDVRDWDGDGLNDIIVGSYDGFLFLYRNTGSTRDPAYEEKAELFNIDGKPIEFRFNLHPRVFDFNGDGLLDIAYGTHWGPIGVFTNTEGFATLGFPRATDIRLENDRILDAIIDSIEGDSMPDFGDLNGDGCIDVIVGGGNGKVYVMYGVSHREIKRRIEAILVTQPRNLDSVLKQNDKLRKEYEALHQSLRILVQEIQPAAEIRREIRDWYMSHPEIASLRP